MYFWVCFSQKFYKKFRRSQKEKSGNLFSSICGNPEVLIRPANEFLNFSNMYLFLRYFKKLQFLKFICPNLISRAPSKSNTNCIKQSTSIITKLSYNLNESFAFLNLSGFLKPLFIILIKFKGLLFTNVQVI